MYPNIIVNFDVDYLRWSAIEYGKSFVMYLPRYEENGRREDLGQLKMSLELPRVRTPHWVVFRRRQKMSIDQLTNLNRQRQDLRQKIWSRRLLGPCFRKTRRKGIWILSVLLKSKKVASKICFCQGIDGVFWQMDNLLYTGQRLWI